ncbi:MAG: hypothetical protein GX847_03525 [Clostridiales bacterium]|nr:hypothetical protein [Clostridiales bacterium]
MDPMDLSTEVITVSGPQDVVSNISYALVTLQRENISKTVVEQRTFTLIDENGHEVVSDKLTFSQDTVNVEIPVNMVKEIPLKVDLIYGAGANSANTSYAISPATISLSGDAEKLDEINHLPIGTIDTTKFLNGKELVFPIVLPNETKNLTGVTEATVTVTISGLESTHVTTSNIAVTNETAGYSAEVITKSIDILLRGTPKDIEKITPDKKGDTDVPVSYRVVADLSDLGDTEGTYSVLAKVYVDGDVDVGAVGDYMVTVRISRD